MSGSEEGRLAAFEASFFLDYLERVQAREAEELNKPLPIYRGGLERTSTDALVYGRLCQDDDDWKSDTATPSSLTTQTSLTEVGDGCSEVDDCA